MGQACAMFRAYFVGMARRATLHHGYARSVSNVNSIHPSDGTSSRAAVAGRDVGGSADLRLVESEERFRGAFEFAAIGMALVAPDGRWLRVNSSLCRIVGYSSEELLATTFQAITHPQDLDTDVEFVQRMLEGTTPHYQMEKRYFHKDGHLVWILLSVSLVRDGGGRPLHFVSQIQDISARKEAEARLIDSELRYRIITDLVPGFVYEGILSGGRMHMTWVSAGFERVYGCSLETFHRLGRERFYDPVALATVLAGIADVARGADVRIEVPIRRFNGEERWVRIVGRAVRVADGLDKTRVLGIIEDITGSRRLERALIDANHQEQQRLSNELHDGLGQDLTGLAYLASALAKEAQRTRSRLAGQISALSGLARHAVEACSDIARGISPLTESRGSLIAALRQTVERANAGGRARVEFRVNDSAPLSLSQESLNQLYRIAQEALNNALKHSTAEHIVLALEIDPARIRIEVADDGCGFPQSPARPGGLGLDSMRYRASAIGARLSIQTSEPHGVVVNCECRQTPGVALMTEEAGHG
jgi:PAS domain S-box-containing protein